MESKWKKFKKWYSRSIEKHGFLLILIFIGLLIAIYYLLRILGLYKYFGGFDDIDKQNFVNIGLFFGILFTFWEAYKFRLETKINDEKPVLALFVRPNYEGAFEDFIIENENVDERAINVKNMGKGVAFELNVKTDKDNVIVDMYEEKIIDSNGQEHSIRLVNKDEEYNMVKMSDLDNMILFLECKSVSGRKYCYKYRIVNVEKYLVEYLGEIKDF